MMVGQVFCQPAYVIHSRPYKESSALVTLLTPDYGRIEGVAKGVRRKKSRNRSLLQPLQPLHISWRGHNELKTLSDIEACGGLPVIGGRALASVLYANEVLSRLLLPEEPAPDVFREYALLLTQLEHSAPLEPALRRFEWQLLAALGYPILFQTTSGAPIRQDCCYLYHWQSGFSVHHSGFSGRILLDLANDADLSDQHRRVAKQLSRIALQPLLGDKPLLSRQLFVSHRQQ